MKSKKGSTKPSHNGPEMSEGILVFRPLKSADLSNKHEQLIKANYQNSGMTQIKLN